MKKSHRQSARPSSSQVKRPFNFRKHPWLSLAGTWAVLALLGGISLEILVHPTGERRVGVTQIEPETRPFEFPAPLYGAIALMCTTGSVLVYRRYRQKLANARVLKVSPTKARSRQKATIPIKTETRDTTSLAQTPSAPPKTRSRRRKIESIPMTSDGYSPRPVERQSPGIAQTRSGSGKLVEAMDVRGRQSLDSLLSDRQSRQT